MPLKKTIYALLFLLTISAQAQVDFENQAQMSAMANGQKLYKTKCHSCHGAVGDEETAPNLFGIQGKFIIKAMRDFRKKVRDDNFMGAMPSIAKKYNEQDYVDLALFLESQNPCDSEVIKETLGGDIFRGQELITKNYCMFCHNERPGAYAPFMSGQKTIFLKQSLENFRCQIRHDKNMYGLVSHFEDNDILDMAAYLNSLRECSADRT